MKNRNLIRSILVLSIIGVAFFGAFQFAQARSANNAVSTVAAANGAPQPASAAGGPACACCSSGAASGAAGAVNRDTAKLSGGVQTIAVDLSTGTYNPGEIVLKAGVPAEITFGQSSGCTGQVMSKDLNFFEDLTTGAKTVKLPALTAGEYSFSCGMQMVFGKIVVE
ncbi:MAG: hypothetical protein CVT67_07900 [Actinobacteria bacterium HGW-Actinobacteria-7]|nr:MAG: hypothetical protein CVT67_07900 [Actinobacteria bacterium HGW-Actinobacteria-7]